MTRERRDLDTHNAERHSYQCVRVALLSLVCSLSLPGVGVVMSAVSSMECAQSSTAELFFSFLCPGALSVASLRSSHSSLLVVRLSFAHAARGDDRPPSFYLSSATPPFLNYATFSVVILSSATFSVVILSFCGPVCLYPRRSPFPHAALGRGV